MSQELELSRNDIEYLVSQWILNERDRKLILRRMCDGVRYEALAEEFDLSVQRVKMIVYKGKDKIYRHIDMIKK